jgi:hypothetical protein
MSLTVRNSGKKRSWPMKNWQISYSITTTKAKPFIQTKSPHNNKTNFLNKFPSSSNPLPAKRTTSLQMASPPPCCTISKSKTALVTKATQKMALNSPLITIPVLMSRLVAPMTTRIISPFSRTKTFLNPLPFPSGNANRPNRLNLLHMLMNSAVTPQLMNRFYPHLPSLLSEINTSPSFNKKPKISLKTTAKTSSNSSSSTSASNSTKNLVMTTK